MLDKEQIDYPRDVFNALIDREQPVCLLPVSVGSVPDRREKDGG